jgi:hypothetical protein
MRLALAPLLAVVLACAGCTSPAEPPAADDGQTIAEDGPTFNPPVTIGGGGAYEATIVIRDQTTLVCQQGNAETDVLLASLDSGNTWTRVPIDRGVQASSDCDVAIGNDGTWYIVFLDVAEEEIFGNGFTDGLLVFGASHDQGATWTWTTLPGAMNGLVDRPWLRVVGDSLYLTHKSGNILPLTVWFQRSDDGGATWSPPVLVARTPGPGHPNGNVGKMWVSEDGNVIRIPLHTFDVTKGEGRDEWLDLAVSTDAGATWTVKPVAGPLPTRADNFLPSLGVVGETTYVAVPLANGSTAADLTLVASTDRGDTWSDPILLARAQDYSEARSQASVALDAGRYGTMDAAWYHWDDGWIVSMARLNGTRVDWSRDLTTPEGKAIQLEFLGLAHDASSKVRIVYSVPMDPCPDFGGQDCVRLVTES